MSLRFGAAALLLVAARTAAASEPLPTETAQVTQTTQPRIEAAPDAKAEAKEDREPRPEIELSGRVFFRAAATKVDAGDFSTDFELASARLEARRQWRRLRVVVEVELARKARLKDAFVRWRKGPLRVQAGQFKEPGSNVELESTFDLPVVDRGTVHDLLDRFAIGGRRPGVQFELAGGGRLDPSLRVGVFQGIDARGDLLAEPGSNGLGLAARAEISPGGIGLGLFGGWRALEPIDGGGVRRLGMVGADVTMQRKLGRTRLRIWLDGTVGENAIDHDQTDSCHATFAAGRAIVAFAVGAQRSGARYVEPYVHAGAVDPDLDVGDDQVVEAGLGANIGRWDRMRLSLELNRRGVATRNAVPFLGGDAALVSRSAILVQLATRL